MLDLLVVGRETDYIYDMLQYASALCRRTIIHSNTCWELGGSVRRDEGNTWIDGKYNILTFIRNPYTCCYNLVTMMLQPGILV